MRINEIRQKFLEFFRSKGHAIVPSDSLVPSGDPTLLFTSAGMVQFKKHFLGQTRLDFRRAASCQKCLRTSDIERVGLTARHLTFFEMLGNFSFGDYFKTEAIAWAWEFLTEHLKLDTARLYPTIYKDDEEAFELWKKIVPAERIVRLGEDSNFWTMGPTGPCGPCSEILYDRGARFSEGHDCPGPGCDCDRYMEIWNLVFTQFDQAADGTLTPLPQKNIDTGMGLERLAVAVNGLDSSFETDTFSVLTAEIRKLIGENATVVSQRIISDHIRASAFLISDGVLPSNEGRGYVLRRLLRRALRAGWTQGRKQPFLNLLVPVLAREMGEAYPQLTERAENIQSIIQTEERNALETIESGTRLLEQEVKAALDVPELKPPVGKVSLSGDKVFHIYDTYGLDKEIQKEIVRDWKGELVFSEEDYEKAKAKAVEVARKGWKGSGERELTLYSQLWKRVGDSAFRGYEALELETQVAAVLKFGAGGPGESDALAEGEEGEVVLRETPFYAESGGQVGDQGTISNAECQVRVLDTQKPYEGLIAQRVKVERGRIRSGDLVRAQVDAAQRKHTMRHHTATHLLHAALRRALGSQVTQAGSLVAPEKLRFDFTYPKALSPEQLAAIERDVNSAVLANIQRKRSEGSLDDARKQGALAFFGDKYGSKVFVVNYGQASTEVCGGTHCESTGDIGLFKIVSESSVGSGVRRLEAVAGEKAYDYVTAREKILAQIAEKLRASPADALDKLERMAQKQAELERELDRLARKGQSQSLGGLAEKAKTVPVGAAGNGSVKILAQRVEGMSPAGLREAADLLRDKLGSGIVVLATDAEDKTSFVVSLSEDCVKRGLHAGKIAKELAGILGGSGGGRDAFAQGGGKAVPNLAQILDGFPDQLAQKLKA